jgi:hypothetical protein
MKRIIIILYVLVAFIQCTNEQEKINEKRVIKEKHIDFNKGYLYFELHGLIEIDGHIFLNDTMSCPIVYKADLEGIEIINECNKKEYEYRKCDKKGCEIIHLNLINELKLPVLKFNNPLDYYFNPD